MTRINNVDTSGFNNTAALLIQGNNQSQDRELAARQLLAEISRDGVDQRLRANEQRLRLEQMNQEQEARLNGLNVRMSEMLSGLVNSQRERKLRESIESRNNDTTIRGQDLNAKSNAAQVDVTARGQDLRMESDKAANALTARGQDLNKANADTERTFSETQNELDRQNNLDVANARQSPEGSQEWEEQSLQNLVTVDPETGAPAVNVVAYSQWQQSDNPEIRRRGEAMLNRTAFESFRAIETEEDLENWRNGFVKYVPPEFKSIVTRSLTLLSNNGKIDNKTHERVKNNLREYIEQFEQGGAVVEETTAREAVANTDFERLMSLGLVSKPNQEEPNPNMGNSFPGLPRVNTSNDPGSDLNPITPSNNVIFR